VWIPLEPCCKSENNIHNIQQHKVHGCIWCCGGLLSGIGYVSLRTISPWPNPPYFISPRTISTWTIFLKARLPESRFPESNFPESRFLESIFPEFRFPEHPCFFRAYFWKKIALLNSFTLSVRLYPIYHRLSTYDLQILDSKRKLSI
jgi:hypothetical protein